MLSIYELGFARMEMSPNPNAIAAHVSVIDTAKAAVVQQRTQMAEYFKRVEKERKSRAWLKMIFTAALALGAFSLAVVASNLLCHATISLKGPIMRTMHLTHVSSHTHDRVSSWISLDWIMQPNMEHQDVYLANIKNKDSGDSVRSTSAAPWQLSDACPPPHLSVETWETSGVLSDPKTQASAFFCDPEVKDATNCPTEVADGTTRYPNPLMYFVCRLNRVPTIGVFEGDPTSFSFASAHSPVALVYFMQVVTLVVALFETVRLWNFYYMDEVLPHKLESKAESEQHEIKARHNEMRAQQTLSLYIVLLCVLAFWVFLVRFLMISLENIAVGDKGDDRAEVYNALKHRPMPNGSFLYGISAFVLVAFVTVHRLRRFFREPSYGEHGTDAMLTNDEHDDSSTMQILLFLHDINATTDTPPTDTPPAPSLTPQQKTMEGPQAMGAQMNVSGFSSTRKIPIAAYQVDKAKFVNVTAFGPVPQGKSRKSIKPILSVPRFKLSTWSIAQLALVPLWLFASISATRGFELDVDTQLTLVTAFVLCVSDIYLDRFTSIAHACRCLDAGMLHNVHVWVSALVIAVQVLLAIILNYCTGWRASQRAIVGTATMHTTDADFGIDDSSAAATAGIVLFNLYFALASLIKVVRVYYDQKPPTAGEKEKLSWFSIRTLDELLLGLLLFIVFIYSGIILAQVDGSKSWYESVHTTFGGEAGISAEEEQVLFWRSNWVPTHGVGM